MLCCRHPDRNSRAPDSRFAVSFSTDTMLSICGGEPDAGQAHEFGLPVALSTSTLCSLRGAYDDPLRGVSQLVEREVELLHQSLVSVPVQRREVQLIPRGCGGRDRASASKPPSQHRLHSRW